MTSATFVANRQRIDDPHGVQELIEINNPGFVAPVRLANDTRDWMSGGVTYTGFPFRFTYPQDSADEAPQSKLEIDNVGRDLMGELEAMPAGTVLSCGVKLIDRSTPDTVEWSWTVPISTVSADAALVTATLSVDYLMRQQACKLRHDPHTSPGIF